MNNYYDDNAKTFIENTLNLDMTSFYKRFENHADQKKTLLDIGCGPGRDLKYFAKKYQALGLEPSSVLAEHARTYADVDVVNSKLEDFETDQTFDMIWACASLLHIPRKDLSNAFLKISTLMNSEGIFYCSFKYGTKEEIRDIRHFTDMTEELLDEVLKATSLKVLDFWKSQDVRPGRENEFWGNWVLTKP